MNILNKLRDSFPNVWVVYQFLNQPDLNGTFINEFLSNGTELGLRQIDIALQSLLAGRQLAELTEQLRDLFGNDKKHYKAETELLGLSFFETNGLLRQIGYPSGASDTPEFECLIEINNVPYCIDIKAAGNTGYHLLESALKETFLNWANVHSIRGDQYYLSVHHEGDIAQQRIGKLKIDIKNKFMSALNGFGNKLPKKIDLPINAELTLIIGLDTDHLHGGGGIVSLKSRIDSITSTVIDHVRDKGKHAIRFNLPYFIAYVRQPGRGHSDFRPENFQPIIAATESVLSTESCLPFWAGALYLDWTVYPSKSMLSVRQSPTIVSSLSSAQIEEAFQL